MSDCCNPCPYASIFWDGQGCPGCPAFDSGKACPRPTDEALPRKVFEAVRDGARTADKIQARNEVNYAI